MWLTVAREQADGAEKRFEQDYYAGLVDFVRGADVVYHDTNFTDQDARLVCLVCYKIFPPGQHEQYRTHVSGHPRAALAKIHIQKPLPFKCAACLSAFATEKLLREHELVRVFHSV